LTLGLRNDHAGCFRGFPQSQADADVVPHNMPPGACFLLHPSEVVIHLFHWENVVK